MSLLICSASISEARACASSSAEWFSARLDDLHPEQRSGSSSSGPACQFLADGENFCLGRQLNQSDILIGSLQTLLQPAA